MEYRYQTIEMPDDYEGRVVVTLISTKQNPSTSASAVLYIHGYIDYFFNDHLARYCLDKGAPFFALELRKCGRSKLPHQHFNYCRSMEEYFADVDVAIKQIQSMGFRRIVLLGHSTGGLLSAVYAAKGYYRSSIVALVLNSPFFQLNTSWVKKYLMLPLLFPLLPLFAYLKIPNPIPRCYGESLHREYKGEWAYDLTLKPIGGAPLYVAWLKAVCQAQRMLRGGLGIEVPALVMSSNKSHKPDRREEWIPQSDVVLNVADIRRYSTSLGNRVTYAVIDGGMHDLFLSKEVVRTKALEYSFSWLACNGAL